mmetsp:Transcript_100121/g.172840  ORF Transcript_100121/g.172840 Transcript_100121/m.172840 type:complete len:253 (-) Transcript_100121:110-868(-)
MPPPSPHSSHPRARKPPPHRLQESTAPTDANRPPSPSSQDQRSHTLSLGMLGSHSPQGLGTAELQSVRGGAGLAEGCEGGGLTRPRLGSWVCLDWLRYLPWIWIGQVGLANAVERARTKNSGRPVSKGQRPVAVTNPLSGNPLAGHPQPSAHIQRIIFLKVHALENVHQILLFLRLVQPRDPLTALLLGLTRTLLLFAGLRLKELFVVLGLKRDEPHEEVAHVLPEVFPVQQQQPIHKLAQSLRTHGLAAPN